MRKRVVEKRRLQALDPSGKAHTVVVWQEYLYAGTLAGDAWAEGLQAYRLLDGSPVNEEADGTLTVVSTGLRLRTA